MNQTSSVNPSVQKTKDGSNTLYSSRFDQTYHSRRGAVAESEHNFFDKNGLNTVLNQKDEINILEIGFGTGLNLLLLLDKYWHKHSSAQINYHTVEAYPISSLKARALNYAEFLHHPELAESVASLFNKLSSGMNTFKFSDAIAVHLFKGTFAHYNPSDIQFDFIFHDAFSPKVNPELWSANVFEKILHQSHHQAILTTYSAASKPRGALVSAGWKVARAKGALGKREMTVASPASDKLKKLERVNEERLAQRYRKNDL